jgi:hypothetical protein
MPCSDPLWLVEAPLALSRLTGIDVNLIPQSPVSIFAVPLAEDDWAERGLRRWEGTRPEAMWHPLMWLPRRLAMPLVAVGADGDVTEEPLEQWQARVAFEITDSQLYTDDGWVDVLALAGLDADDAADLDRVRSWLAGAPDDSLDALDLEPFFTDDPHEVGRVPAAGSPGEGWLERRPGGRRCLPADVVGEGADCGLAPDAGPERATLSLGRSRRLLSSEHPLPFGTRLVTERASKVRRRRVIGVAAGSALLVAALGGCGSSVNTDDPSAVAAGTLNALAESDCKTVIKLYPNATTDESYPADGCTNELAGHRALGTYSCSPVEGLEQSATVANIDCKSDRDPATTWDVLTELTSDGWVVTSVA